MFGANNLSIGPPHFILGEYWANTNQYFQFLCEFPKLTSYVHISLHEMFHVMTSDIPIICAKCLLMRKRKPCMHRMLELY